MELARRHLVRIAGATATVGLAETRKAQAQAVHATAPNGASVRGSPIDLAIERAAFEVDGRRGSAVVLNRTVPGPLIRLREGDEAVLRVTNYLAELSSIHWHGLILPPDMDGVPA